jgi:hypothetical protein
LEDVARGWDARMDYRARDYLIAATALTEGTELATMNVRHYRCFPASHARLRPGDHLTVYSGAAVFGGWNGFSTRTPE